MRFVLAIEANASVITNPKKTRCITPRTRSILRPCFPARDCTSSRMPESGTFRTWYDVRSSVAIEGDPTYHRELQRSGDWQIIKSEMQNDSFAVALSVEGETLSTA
jgi:hypothetical protein